MRKFYLLISLLIASSLVGQNRLNDHYHTYDEIRDSLFSWDEQFGNNSNPSDQYPGSGIIYHLEEIGTSTHDGLPFWGVRLSYNADVKEDEPRTLFLGQCHAEEILGVEITMDIISKFLHPEDNPDWAYNMGALLLFSEIWVVPTHNPEGLRVVHGYEENGNWLQDESYRKNKRDVDFDGVFDFLVGIGNDSDGVDLNRNYDFNWNFGDGAYEYDNGSGSYQSHFDYYKGEEPFSELEMQAIRDFAFREDFLLSIAYHSSRSGSVSEKVIYSWFWEDAKSAPDLEVINPIGIEIAEKIIREDGGGGYLPVAHGSRKGNAHDWFYSQVGTIQFLIEVGTQNMQPDDIELIENTIDRNLNGAFYMMNRAIGYNSGSLGASANQVTGLVTDSYSGSIIENAHVRILELDGGMLKPRKTDEFGRYRRLLTNGTYTIEIKAEGYITQFETVTSSSGFISEKNFNLIPKSMVHLNINLNVPNEFEDEIHVEFKSDIKTFSFVLSSGNNSIPLFSNSYEVKISGQDLFSRFLSLELVENTTIQVNMKFSNIVIDESFDNLQNWAILIGSWVNELGKLKSQSDYLYDFGNNQIKYNSELNIFENLDYNLILELKNEFEWDHDFGFIDFDSTNNTPEYLINNHNWEPHHIEIPMFQDMNQLIIGFSADSTVQYRGLEINNFKLVSEQNQSCDIGDINQDDVFDIRDVLFIINHITSYQLLSDYQLCPADWNADNHIDIYDIIAIRNELLGN